MKKKKLHIDENKCDGCGVCTVSCHANAIEIINSKAKLMREENCDGMGECLSSCHHNALSLHEYEYSHDNHEAIDFLGNILGRHICPSDNCSIDNYKPNETQAILPVSMQIDNENGKVSLKIKADLTSFIDCTAIDNYSQPVSRVSMEIIHNGENKGEINFNTNKE